ncbi:MAG: SDR family oxidoreductase [Candidatus Eiseniibacteriota bacterium]
MDLELNGRRALVAGASAGIGFAVARALAAEGARVALVSRDPARIGAAAERIRRETGGEALPLTADLTEAGAPERVVTEAARGLGGLEILVTNAGGPRPGNFGDVAAEDFARAFELTFRSAERLIRAALPHVGAAGWGRIVCLTSITAKEPHDGLVLSNCLRPAVHGLAKSLSRSAGPGITVNCVCPGFTDTERLRDLAAARASSTAASPDSVYAAWRARIPRGELGRPEEVAAAVAFLCSGPASFINGATLAVDGGESRPLL